ncbi:MAG: hypothetical protein [Microviridae sp.]|nr:MAG: hypothetical protein [Microviridae sp.]
MITLNDIHSWENLPAGEAMPFDNDYARPVTLDINTSKKVPLYIMLAGEGVLRLLALVEGRETLKFVVPGAYAITHKDDEADVYFYTRDGSVQHRVALDDEESFTTHHEFVERDPALVAIEEKMMRRFRRREKELEQAFERVNATKPVGAAADNPSVSEPVADEGSTKSQPSVPDDKEALLPDDGDK